MEFTQIDLKDKHVTLQPISDVQSGVTACDEERLRRYVDEGMERGAYFIGIGDYVDMAAPSDRRRLRQAEFYDVVTEAICAKAEYDIDNFLRLVEGTEGRWLGLVQGHHYMTFPDGTTSDTRIAEALGCPFLGDCATLRVKFGGVTCNVLVHHGQGSTSNEAAALNAVMKFGAGHNDVDIVLNGHHHKKVATKKPRTYYDVEGKQAERSCTYAVTGSYLRGFMDGSIRDGRPGGSYVEQRLLPPVALGGIVLTLRDVKGTLDVDVTL